MKQVLLGIVLAVIGFVVFLSIRLGVFRDVNIVTTNAGPFHLVYTEHIGPYHKVVESIQKVENWNKSHGMDCSISFGEYIDDPNIVEHERLRSNVGCLYEALPQGFIPPEGAELEGGGILHYRMIPNRGYVIGTFSGSPSLGPYKAYGKIETHIQNTHLEHDGPVMEIYKISGKFDMETRYLFPVK